ncbi:MAG: hypothetical protein ACT4O1_09085 [Gemmatimonadota bacterium]
MRAIGAICAFLALMPLADVVAQTCPPPRAATPSDTTRPDIAIVARVRAAALRFDVRPSATLQVAGCPAVDTTHVVVRTNLPKPVEPGVTYRNVTVDFRLTTRFRDIDCFLAELLPTISADTAAIRGARRACVQRDSMRLH